MSPRRASLASFVHRSSLFLALACLLVVAGTAQAQSLLISSSSVRVRAEPSTAAVILAELPFGTEVAACGRSGDGWTEVETPSGIRGWIASGLAVDVSPSTRLATADRLIRGRLARRMETLGARLELVSFVERLLGETAPSEIAASLELSRFRAVAAVLEQLPFGASPGAPHDRWLADRSAIVAYHDAIGRYILRAEALVRAHARHQRTAAAESMLWLAVVTGFPGECEGSLRCYIGRADATLGDYLRWHPEGRYLDAAIRRLQERATWWRERTDDRYGFSPARECGEILPLLENLKFAVATAAHADRNRTIGLVDDVGLRCR